MKSNRFILPIAFTLFIYFVPFYVQAQITIGSPQVSIDYDNPKEYEIGGITITGVQYLDASVLTMLTGEDRRQDKSARRRNYLGDTKIMETRIVR